MTEKPVIPRGDNFVERLAMLGEMTAGLMHECRNAVTFITNFSQLNQEYLLELEQIINSLGQENKAEQSCDALSALRESLAENTDKILVHSERLHVIAQGALRQSRYGGDCEQCDVSELLRETAALFKQGYQLDKAGQEVSLDCRSSSEAMMVALYPVELSWALLNALANSLHSVRAKLAQSKNYQPEIVLSCHKLNDGLKITVLDNGLGIAKQELDKVFERHYTTKSSAEGSGLGLAFVYNIVVNLHGGTVQMESEEGRFARLTLTL